jgi:FkbM family methyltransferase
MDALRFRQIVNKTLSKFSVRLTDLRRPVGYLQFEGVDIFTPVVRDLAQKSGRSLRLLQVGANDGEREDPVAQLIRLGIVEAILVEPLPQMCEKLHHLHKDNPSVTVVQCAVGPSNGEMPFYYMEDTLGSDLSVYSSLDRDYIEQQRVNEIKIGERESLVRQIEIRSSSVAVRTVAELVKERGWKGLDVLVVDAEGFDDKIVGSVLRDGPTVDCIFFEYSNLPFAEFSAITTDMKSAGYKLAQSGKDILAVREPQPAGRREQSA